MKELSCIVFWGNINIHIYPLAAALSLRKQVYVIISRKLFTNRTERIPKYKETETLKLLDISTFETLDEILSLFDNDYTLQINGRLRRTNHYCSKAMKKLLKNNACVFSLPQEGFQFQGLKKFINTLKWSFVINIVNHKIRAFGLTGDNAFKDFRKIGCNTTKCFPFMYVTAPPTIIDIKEHVVYKVIFVGAIEDRKNIRPIIKTLINNPIQTPYEFHIYGGYGDEESFNKLIEKSSNFFYHGIVPNEKIRQAMLDSDLLILPSLYDGYGAVVNEGLQCGCKILVSDKCGSEFLIKLHEPKLGRVFKATDLSDFKIKFEEIIKEGILTKKEKEYIMNWSAAHISPTIIADYLLKMIDYFEFEQKYPFIPWK